MQLTVNRNEWLGRGAVILLMEACEIHQGSTEGQTTGLFPHQVVRGGQERFLEDARMCMAHRTHLLAHAPTGLGKTAVALTAAVETALASDGVVLFLTSRQSQHAIAVETARGIWRKKRIGVVDIIAREDMCLAQKDGASVPCARGRRCFFSRRQEGGNDVLLDYPLNIQEAMRSCLRAGQCPHQEAMRAAAEAHVIIGDYNQMFGRGPNILQRLGRRESDAILVIDEAHNLPARVMGAGSGSVSALALSHARDLPALRHFTEDVDILAEVFRDLARRDPERIAGEDLDRPLKEACGVDAGGLAEEIETAVGEGSEVSSLIDFLHAWSAPDDVTVRYLDGEPARLRVSLIDPSPVTAPVLARVRSSLIMSGTLHPPEMFAELLGARNAVCRSYPSPFPQENRLVLASGRVSSRYRCRGQTMYASIAEEIARSADKVPGNVAAFFPSYELLGQVEGYLAAMVGDRRILAERREHGKNEKEALVHQLREGRNLLLGTMGGSLSEGVDFRDNLLGAVFIVGLPLAPPSREMEGMLHRMEGKYGTKKANLYVQVYPAISKVLQAAGRAIRSGTDRATIVLLDDRYYLPQVRRAFPQDFIISPEQEIPEKIGAFYIQT
ncbi:MAG: ATP-dependent DNA helicase [Methanomassiliicoccus sp.]|nr:ATP-dependent DNA helicase [Methanomassiliicoccus sp.]